MGWETRERGTRYYTRSRKIGGRVVREYVGSGTLAELVAQQDASTRAARCRELAAKREEKGKETAIERDLVSYYAAVTQVLQQHMEAADFHQHARGEWRRRRMTKPTTRRQISLAESTCSDADELLRRAQRGDHKALHDIITTMRACHGEDWDKLLPGPTQRVRETLLRGMMGNDLLEREIWMMRTTALQRELEGPAPTPLERTLSERAATCWLDVQLTDLTWAQRLGEEMTIATGEYWQRRQERAQRRYLDATMSLARARRLLAPMIAQVNIAQAGAQQLNLANPNLTPAALKTLGKGGT